MNSIILLLCRRKTANNRAPLLRSCCQLFNVIFTKKKLVNIFKNNERLNWTLCPLEVRVARIENRQATCNLYGVSGALLL